MKMFAFLCLHDKKDSFVFKSLFPLGYRHVVISLVETDRCWDSAGCRGYQGRL